MGVIPGQRVRSGDARASKRRHSYILQPPAGLRGPGITAGDVPNARVCHFAREPRAPLGAPAGHFAGTGEPSGVDGLGRRSWGVDNAVGIEHRSYRQRRPRDHAAPVKPQRRDRPIRAASPLRTAGALRMASCCGNRVHICWSSPGRDAVESSRCSCERLGIAHSALPEAE
jgi:hypothetical protein